MATFTLGSLQGASGPERDGGGRDRDRSREIYLYLWSANEIFLSFFVKIEDKEGRARMRS